MHFHHFKSTRPQSFCGSIDKYLDDVLSGSLNLAGNPTEKTQYAGMLLEKAWRMIDRPYYNVYPIVESLCRKTALSVPWEKVSFTFSPLLFRFAAGHEPHGIASALIYTVPPPNVCGFDFGELPAFRRPWSKDGADCFQETPCVKVQSDLLRKQARQACGYLMSRSLICFVQFVSSRGTNGFIWSVRSESWEEHVETTLGDKNTIGAEECTGIDIESASQFLARLSVLAALVGHGDDMITPEILSRDQNKYDAGTEPERRWLEERACRSQGRGFSFGKQLQDNSERSPHWRNPHLALFWTGKGREVPVLKLRAGCVVTSTPLADIPTGFLGKEHESDCHDQPLPFSYRVPVPKRMRFVVMQRDKYRCRLCGLSADDGVRLEVDHKVPVAKGGKTTPENLWTLCHPCNNGKSDSDLTVGEEPAA